MSDEQPPPDTALSERVEAASGQGHELDEFRLLVRAAFEQAQAKGKPGWMEMTSAVLKNRILGLTGRQFSQERYGSPSFIHLVRRIPDLIQVLDTTPPFRMRFKGDDKPFGNLNDHLIDVPLVGSVPQERDWRRSRVRNDLWKAILDYSSEHGYVLDAETEVARERQNADADAAELPTIGREQFQEWRRLFVEQMGSSLGTSRKAQLESWIERGGRQIDLPASVRGQWTEFVKKNVYQRLVEFYSLNNLQAPDDMLVEAETAGLPRSEAIDDVVRTRQLRDLILQAVRVMTLDELATVPLPAEVVLRILGRVPSRDE